MKLLELTIRILCDTRPKNIADAVYLYSQTIDNQQSVFMAAKEMMSRKLVRKILIPNTGPKSGYPGYSLWENELLGLGIQKKHIMGTEIRNTESINTLTEAIDMIKYVKEKRYQNIYIVASPFHQLRAFMTSVTAALEYYPEIQIYSYNGKSLPWSDIVAHSQGEKIGSRKNLIVGELNRISTYQKKGDLALDMDVLAYLDKRDKQVI